MDELGNSQVENSNQINKSLDKVKLIIGNGFDLHCGLKSSYNDYFDFAKKHFEYDTIESCIKNILSYFFGGAYYFPFNKQIETLTSLKCNIWDIYFSFCNIAYNRNIENWYDVEKELSFLFKINKEEDIENLFYRRIYKNIEACEDIEERDYHFENKDMFDFAVFFFTKIIEKRMLDDETFVFNDYESFLKLILKELKKFESRFGFFIGAQLQQNERYKGNSYETLTKLCDLNTITSIDSFNFHDYFYDKIKSKVNNINGRFESGIFGVDDSLGIEDLLAPEYFFTKGSRKTDLLLHGQRNKEFSFENVIVYGHSLYESDFGYFFSIFDKLKLNNANADNKIVFAYSIYDEKRREAIILDLNKRINNIIKQYCIDRKINTRLISSLIATNRLLVLEVPVI